MSHRVKVCPAILRVPPQLRAKTQRAVTQISDRATLLRGELRILLPLRRKCRIQIAAAYHGGDRGAGKQLDFKHRFGSRGEPRRQRSAVRERARGKPLGAGFLQFRDVDRTGTGATTIRSRDAATCPGGIRCATGCAHQILSAAPSSVVAAPGAGLNARIWRQISSALRVQSITASAFLILSA